MDKLLADGLIDVLKNEAGLYREVLKISHEKTHIIVEGKAAELDSLTRKEQALVLQIADLEEIREKIAVKFSEYYKKDASQLTVSIIASMLPQGKALELRGALVELSQILKEIKEANSLNAKLIRNSLEYIDFSINLLTGAEASCNMYGNSGQTNDGRKRNLLDVKL
ncbi:MAG: flagellar protein FlgN [Ruminiclostridium sp.]|nr:flagellar protein FlgN [Ruminiclostridium sp.]